MGSEMCIRDSPRALSAYFKAVLNGWVTKRRMNSLSKSSQPCCSLGCGAELDCLEHLCICEKFWEFAHKPRPGGLGLQHLPRSIDAFFMIMPRPQEQDIIRMSLGIYALHRVHNFNTHRSDPSNYNVLKLLSIYARRGAEATKSKHLLKT